MLGGVVNFHVHYMGATWFRQRFWTLRCMSGRYARYPGQNNSRKRRHRTSLRCV